MSNSFPLQIFGSDYQEILTKIRLRNDVVEATQSSRIPRVEFSAQRCTAKGRVLSTKQFSERGWLRSCRQGASAGPIFPLMRCITNFAENPRFKQLELNYR